MTIRLLSAYDKYPINAIVTLDAGTEAGLVAAKLATADTTSGVAYVAPVAAPQRYNAQVEIDAAGAVLGLAHPNGNRFVVIGGTVPSSLDGRADGTLYFQNGVNAGATGIYAKVAGAYKSVSGGGSVATITGSFALGQTLTAAYPAGTVGTIQFTRTLILPPYTKSAISGAVANSVNSSAYTISKDDQGYTLGVDCSNQVSSAAGGSIPAAVANYLSGDRLISNEKAPTGNSGIRYANFRREAEAPYSGVRIGILYKTGTAPNPVFEAYVATTDTGIVDTQQHIFSPMSNGASVNTVVTGPTTDGWHKLTWNGGADNITAPLAANGGQYAAAFVFSDVLPLVSKARTDIIGARPMTVAKVSQLAAGAAYVGGADRSNWQLAKGMSFFRDELSHVSASADPTVLPTGSPNLNFDDSIAMWFDYRFTVPVRNFLIVGDSREASAASLYGFDSWWRRAIKAKSTTALPCVATNASGSGHSQVQFLAIATAMINAGWSGTDVLLPCFSQNGFAGSATMIANNRVFLDLCISKGYNIYMTTDYGVAGYIAGQAQEVERQKCITEAKRLASIGQVTLVDTGTLLTDYVTDPTKPWLKPQYNTTGASGVEGAANSGDGIHAGPTGQAAMAQLLLALL